MPRDFVFTFYPSCFQANCAFLWQRLHYALPNCSLLRQLRRNFCRVLLLLPPPHIFSHISSIVIIFIIKSIPEEIYIYIKKMITKRKNSLKILCACLMKKVLIRYASKFFLPILQRGFPLHFRRKTLCRARRITALFPSLLL